jgi:hypothetical protein
MQDFQIYWEKSPPGLQVVSPENWSFLNKILERWWWFNGGLHLFRYSFSHTPLFLEWVGVNGSVQQKQK